MRKRRRYAALVVLLALFVLPVVRPEGFPALEGWFDGALHWTSRLGLASPRAAQPGGSATDADGERARDLAVTLLEQREAYFGFVEEANQRLELRDATRELGRLPLARAARVLRAHDASDTRRSILIDLGTADGVTEGLAVVQGGVFVGTIQRADAHTSRVQLLTDPPARLEVAVRTREGARVTAWLRGGQGDDSMRLRNVKLSEGTVLRVDDAVLTSNSNELVPAGLVVGRVVSSTDDDADSLPDVRIRPLFDLSRSTTVLVLLPPR